MSWRDYPIIGSAQDPGGWRNYPIISQEETDEEQELLEYHRERQRLALIPNIEAGAIQMTASMAGLAQRVTGGLLGDPDVTARYARAAAQAAEEEAAKPGKVLPPIISRGVRSVVGTMPPQVLAGLATGGLGAIGLATAQEMNQAVFEGKEAGLKGAELAKYVGTQGTIEAAPEIILRRFGMGGFEAIFDKVAKKAFSGGVRKALKKASFGLTHELIGEIPTEVGHDIQRYMGNVDPEAPNWKSVGETVANTIVATTMQMGLASAPGVARAAMVRGEPEAAPGEPQAAPSRADWLARNRERLMAETQPQAAPEAVREGAVEPVVTEVAPEFAPGIPATEPVPISEGFSLTKKRGARIRRDLDLPEISESKVESWPSVMNRVAKEGMHEKAGTIARETIATKRQLSTDESVALLFKADMVEDQRQQVIVELAAAKAKNDKAAYNIATDRIDALVSEMDVLTRGSLYGKRENARAMSIGQLVLKKERNNLPSVLAEIQSVMPEGQTISAKTLKQATDWVDNYDTALKDMVAQEETDRVNEETKEAEIAEKVVAANKPKRKVGKAIREKAVSEREDIKKRVRAMGHQVHDVSGVTVEGTYLIGRLGLTYVKEGAGTLTEVLERLQTDMPQLNLTQSEVNRALIQRSPKYKTRVRSKAQKRKSKLLSLARMETEIEDMANGVATKAKKRESVDAEVAAMKKKLTKLINEYYYSEIEADKLQRAVIKIHDLQNQLTNGLRNQKSNPRVVSPELASLHGDARKLRTEIRIDSEIAKIEEQHRTGIYPEPIIKEQKLESRQLQIKRMKLTKLRKEKQQIIADAAPWTTGKVIGEIAGASSAMKTAGDISFVGRQLGPMGMGHPWHAARAFYPAMEAGLDVESSEWIQEVISKSPNSFYYDVSKLAILDVDSPRAVKQAEAYKSKVIENFKIAGRQNPLGIVIAASGRHAVAYGNLMRTQRFDAFLKSAPNATLEEMTAISDWINVFSGIGNLGRAGVATENVQRAFFSLKFSVSRVQAPYILYKHWKLPRVRKEIAKDIAKFLGVAFSGLAAASALGATVEWWDVDDP
ncbi:hypothetical protein LCGC14_1610060, partial [marine sediment metagenome]